MTDDLDQFNEVYVPLVEQGKTWGAAITSYGGSEAKNVVCNMMEPGYVLTNTDFTSTNEQAHRMGDTFSQCTVL